jgi:hypothetical protein
MEGICHGVNDGKSIMRYQAIILFFVRLHPSMVIRIIRVECFREGTRARLCEVACRDMGCGTPDNTWCFGPAGDQRVHLNKLLVMSSQVWKVKSLFDLSIARKNFEVPRIGVSMMQEATMVLSFMQVKYLVLGAYPCR